MQCHEDMWVLSVPKKTFVTHIGGVWHITLNHVVSSNDMTYTNVVIVPTENYNIHDIHHPIERYLTSYLVVGVLLPKSKLHKVRAERKSQLVLLPDKTNIVFIWTSKRILTAVFENRTVRNVLYP
jgi:hypothetical protein